MWFQESSDPERKPNICATFLESCNFPKNLRAASERWMVPYASPKAFHSPCDHDLRGRDQDALRRMSRNSSSPRGSKRASQEVVPQQSRGLLIIHQSFVCLL